MKESNFSITFKDNRTGQKDITLKISNPKLIRKFDSFYFIADKQPEPLNGAQKSLIDLLNYWVTVLKSIKVNQVKFLPIEFTDQYLGTFKISCKNELVLEFEFGFILKIKGEDVSPSNPEIINNQENEFKSDSKVLNFEMKRDSVINDLEISILNLKKELKTA